MKVSLKIKNLTPNPLNYASEVWTVENGPKSVNFFLIFWNIDLEQNFCCKKVLHWSVEVFVNFFLVRPPKNPPGGYFGDFLTIFVILGFKWPKMSHTVKVLSQKGHILASWKIILKKIRLDLLGHPKRHKWLNSAKK